MFRNRRIQVLCRIKILVRNRGVLACAQNGRFSKRLAFVKSNNRTTYYFSQKLESRILRSHFVVLIIVAFRSLMQDLPIHRIKSKFKGLKPCPHYLFSHSSQILHSLYGHHRNGGGQFRLMTMVILKIGGPLSALVVVPGERVLVGHYS